MLWRASWALAQISCLLSRAVFSVPYRVSAYHTTYSLWASMRISCRFGNDSIMCRYWSVAGDDVVGSWVEVDARNSSAGGETMSSDAFTCQRPTTRARADWEGNSLVIISDNGQIMSYPTFSYLFIYYFIYWFVSRVTQIVTGGFGWNFQGT